MKNISLDTVEGKDKLDPLVIQQIQETIEHRCSTFNRAVSVEEVQDMVEKELYDHHAYNLMKNYMLYRYQHQRNREGTEFDSKILSLLNNSNEEINQENANKNPVIVSTQRDYMAGEVSKEICKKYIFDDELLSAHSSGIIHIHDTDYIAQSMYNCSLVNLEDMLQNGTVISGTKIDTPKSFATACNVATQILAQVASSQFGGQTLNLYHLVPFVESSRAKIRKDVEEEFKDIGYNESDYLEKIDKITEKRLLKEIENGVQTIQYQILTLMTTNG